MVKWHSKDVRLPIRLSSNGQEKKCFFLFPHMHFKWQQPWDTVDITILVTCKNFHPSLSSVLVRRSHPVVRLGVSTPTAALTTRDACLLGGNTLDLKPFLCPHAGYLCYIGSAHPSLNCSCPEPADTGYNGGIDVLLRNPWVRIKELPARQQGQQGSVWTQNNVFLLHPACPQHVVALLPSCKKKKKKREKTFHVISHARFMDSSQSNMLDNMLGLCER